MNPVDLLPDNWFEVASGHVMEILYKMQSRGVKMDAYCLTCPFCKPTSIRKDTYMCSCFNKCIKEYPTINDNEMFL